MGVEWVSMGDDLQHGKRSTYVNKKCRCVECKAANREYKLNKTADNRTNTEATALTFSEAFGTEEIPILTHGLPSTYEWWGCRCYRCKAVMRPIWRTSRRRNRILRLVS